MLIAPETMTLIGVLAGAAIGLIGSWLTQRYQFKTKKLELRGQAELRARELLFQAYQNKIEGIGQQGDKIADHIKSMVASVQGKPVEQQNRELAVAGLMIIGMISNVIESDIIELEEEVRLAGLAEKREKQIAIIRHGFRPRSEEVKPDDWAELYLGLMRSTALMHSLRSELLNKKAEELFSDYIQPNKSLTR